MAIEPNEARLRSYLLAELSEEERDELEKAFFADDELFQVIRAIEAEMIDEYVSGALSAEDHRRFTERFLTSPDRCSRVDFARALQQTMVVATARLSRLEKVRELLGLNRPAMLAFATVSVVVALSAVLLLWWTRQGGQVVLQDTAGEATLTRSQTIVLARLGALPPELSSSVRSMIISGSAAFAPRAAMEIDGLRGVNRGTRLPDPPTSRPEPVPLSPLQTGVRSDQPTLRWRGVPGARGYAVTIGDRDNRKVWERATTSETEATVPPGVLQRGALYFWQVGALEAGDSAGPRVGFWIVDAQTLKNVEDVEQTYRGSALVLAATYDQHGLYEEALAQVNQLAGLNPGSAAIQTMLTHLNSQLVR